MLKRDHVQQTLKISTEAQRKGPLKNDKNLNGLQRNFNGLQRSPSNPQRDSTESQRDSTEPVESSTEFNGPQRNFNEFKLVPPLDDNPLNSTGFYSS